MKKHTPEETQEWKELQDKLKAKLITKDDINWTLDSNTSSEKLPLKLV